MDTYYNILIYYICSIPIVTDGHGRDRTFETKRFLNREAAKTAVYKPSDRRCSVL